MGKRDSLLTQGIAAAKAGDKNTARRLLTQAVRRDPAAEAGWLWLSEVLDTPQGKAFCLQRVLALNPNNRAALKGLAALESAAPAPVVVAQPSPPAPPPRIRQVPAPKKAPTGSALWANLVRHAHFWQAAARQKAVLGLASLAALVRQARFGLAAAFKKAATALASSAGLVRQARFWQVVVMGLAIVAFGLVAALLYATFNRSSAAEDEMLAAVSPSPTPWPRGTLRPTFTPTWTPTPTPTPTDTSTPTFTPTSTPTFTPTFTPTSTPRPKPKVQRSAATAAPVSTPVPRPTLPPRSLDPRLAQLGVRVESAFVGVGQPYWRLVEARWTDAKESGGKHSIFVEALNANGSRAVGQPVIVQWAGGNVVLTVEDKPLPDWGVDFPMYNTLGSYSVNVGGAPSDSIVGLGLGTIEAPEFRVHTSFYLTFRLVYR
jgi:hypothetical protein